MVKQWYISDPEPDVNGVTGYTYILYRKPRTERETKLRQLRAFKRECELEKIYADPMTAFKYERDMEIRSRVRVLERQPKFAHLSTKDLVHYVKSFMNNDNEPLIIKNPNFATGKKPDDVDKPHTSKQARRLHKIEKNAEEGNFTVEVFEAELIEKIKQTRQHRSMTQKDLAMLVNRHESDIKALEKGELAFDRGLKALLLWKLGITA